MGLCQGQVICLEQCIAACFLTSARCAGLPPSPVAAGATRPPPSPKPGPPVFVVTQPGGGLDLAVRVTPDADTPAPGSHAAASAKVQASAGGDPLLQTRRMPTGGAGARWQHASHYRVCVCISANPLKRL